MIRPKATLIVLAVILAMAAVLVAQEKPWFDMKNCEFCKPWSTPEMMKNLTFDQKPISAGVMSITFVKPGFMDAYKKASAEMEAISKRAFAGEKVTMCGSCEMMGSFFARGTKMEEVYLKDAVVMLMTSSDSALVADMHKWTKRNADEEKKLKATEEKK